MPCPEWRGRNRPACAKTRHSMARDGRGEPQPCRQRPKAWRDEVRKAGGSATSSYRSSRVSAMARTPQSMLSTSPSSSRPVCQPPPGVAQVVIDQAPVGLDQQIGTQTRQTTIGQPLLAPLDVGGRGRQHLDDDAGRGLVVRVVVRRIAAEHHVRVMEGVLSGNAQLHFRDVGAAGAAARYGADMEGGVQRDAVVPLAGARHGVDLTGDIFVLDRGFGLQAQIVLDGQGDIRIGPGHGRLPRDARPGY